MLRLSLFLVILATGGGAGADEHASGDVRPSISEALATEDSLSRALGYQAIDAEIQVEERAEFLANLWDSAGQLEETGEAMQVGIVGYLITHQEFAQDARDLFDSRVAEAARSGPSKLRWAALDYFLRLPPDQISVLSPLLQDQDDDLRAETLNAFWRLGAQDEVREYRERYAGDAERERSLDRADFLMGRNYE